MSKPPTKFPPYCYRNYKTTIKQPKNVHFFSASLIIIYTQYYTYNRSITWRIKNKEELDKLIKHENIVNYIKAQRLSWFGHIQRMPVARAANKIFKWNPLTKTPRGRPKYRWEDIIQDLGQMKIKNWLTCVQDRVKWKDVVQKAKTSN